MHHNGNGYEEVVGGRKWRSCGVARSIIVGFHPADPGSNPGTSIPINNRAQHTLYFISSEGTVVEILNRLIDFFSGIHDKWTIT